MTDNSNDIVSRVERELSMNNIFTFVKVLLYFESHAMAIVILAEHGKKCKLIFCLAK